MTITFPEINGCDEVYLDTLNALIGDKRDSFLDIGCNKAPFTPRLGFKERKYIDILPRELDHKDEQQYFEQADAIDYLENLKRTYSVTFSLDQIEHVTKEYGHWQIAEMESYSHKQIFFTPTEGWMLTSDDDDNPESHRSVWTPEDIKRIESVQIIFPKYHPTLKIGAWFFMFCNSKLNREFERITNELKTKQWTNGMIVS